MKVILVRDLKSIGKKGAIIDVKDGYAKNYLIAKGHAVVATGSNLVALKNKDEQIKLNFERERALILDKYKKLDGTRISESAKASDKGNLFASIGKEEISRLIGVDESEIVLPTPIKNTGEHIIQIKNGDSTANIVLEILAK